MDSQQNDHPEAVTVSATSARQGVISGRVVTVLASSLMVAIVALVVAWLVFR